MVKKKTYVLIVIRSVGSGVMVSKSVLSMASNKLFAIQNHEILDQIGSFQVRYWDQITRVLTFPRWVHVYQHILNTTKKYTKRIVSFKKANVSYIFSCDWIKIVQNHIADPFVISREMRISTAFPVNRIIVCCWRTSNWIWESFEWCGRAFFCCTFSWHWYELKQCQYINQWH